MEYSRLYCDLDGVLVNFDFGAVERCNLAMKNGEVSSNLIKQVRQDLGRDYLWVGDFAMHKKESNPKSLRKLLHTVIAKNREFWATLPFMPDGEQLWRAIGSRAYILSKPMSEECAQGKIEWCIKNLGITKNKIILTSWESSKDKSAYAKNGETPNILIDDYAGFIEPFRAVGGIGILHTSTPDTLRQLQRILSI